jgi:hypothetical protein
MDQIAEMRLKMQYEVVNPLTLEPKTPKSPKYRSIDRNEFRGNAGMVTRSPIHEYSDDEGRYEKPAMSKNIAPSPSNQSMEYYKQKAIEDARRKHMASQQVVETKEIYRTPGYRSRGNSPGSANKSYKGNYKEHRRLTPGVGYDNSSATLQSTAILDNTDYSAKSRKNAESPRFSPKNRHSPSTKKWINETSEQSGYISPHRKATPFQDQSFMSRGSSRSRSRSGSRCRTKPKFEIIEDNDNLKVIEDSKQPKRVYRRSSRSPARRSSPNRDPTLRSPKRYDDYRDYD